MFASRVYTHSMDTAIWWIRRDLRLQDNQALYAALRHERVIPVFVLEPALLAREAPNRQSFLFAGLQALDAELRALGSRLIIRQGPAEEALPALGQETDASVVYAEGDVSPFSLARDSRVAERVNLVLTEGVTIHPVTAVRKGNGEPYTVFTPYSRAWRALPLPNAALPAPQAMPPVADIFSLPVPDHSELSDFPAGAAEAARRLHGFLDGIVDAYAIGRNRMDWDGTSQLSPYLRFGMLSARTAALEVRRVINNLRTATEGGEAWLNELIWRDFYASILHHFPYVLKDAFQLRYRSMRWRTAPDDLERWQLGQTGYPVVDACMRQLLATGWMHNRGRMIAASFLVKDLLIDWREGEAWFMRHLVDGDPAANNGGWQWTAGVGTDAAPYFRIFNPVSQGQRHDPQGSFVRRWVHELAAVSDAYIHQPWTMQLDEQARVGCRLGKDYPLPMVDHAVARERALLAYKSAS